MKGGPEAKGTSNDDASRTSKDNMQLTPSSPGGRAGTEERRNADGHRVHFESVVEVGEAQGGGGFEAESVDVSEDGMRLRTASLPDVGDRLVCRFDGLGLEVVCEGEVIWRKQEARGGEFGLRFVGLEPDAAEAIRALAGEDAEEGAEPKAEMLVPAGTRVRLHIEGLASPMKARVREASSRELEVGSNLEFLRIGRLLELEDVEKGEKREAMVDHVKVDLDPATNVPQLVVSLRYERASTIPEAPRVSAPPPADAPDARRPAQKTRPMTRLAEEAGPPTRRARVSAPPPADEGSAEENGVRNGAAAAFATATRLGQKTVGTVAPMLASAGTRARDAMASLVDTIHKRRVERADAKRSSAPRRTTALPPGGGLKTDGRRLVRDEAAEDEAPPASRSNKRAALLGSGIGLLVVLSVFAMTRNFGGKPATTAAKTEKAAPALPAPAMPETAGGAPIANVPLFGQTPLSTTEPVAPPLPASALAAAAAAAVPPIPTADDAPSGPEKKLVKEWGQGDVHHATVLKIKMDGPIEGLQGASGANGFTISVPGRKSTSSNTDLTRKDRRLAAVKVLNTSQGAEITVQFKDGVPAYQARIKGDRLEIALGDGAKKVASKKSKKKKKK